MHHASVNPSIILSRAPKIVCGDNRCANVTPSDHTSEQCWHPKPRHTSGARHGRLWTRWVEPSGIKFPKSPNLAIGKGVSMLETKMLFIEISVWTALSTLKTVRADSAALDTTLGSLWSLRNTLIASHDPSIRIPSISGLLELHFAVQHRTEFEYVDMRRFQGSGNCGIHASR